MAGCRAAFFSTQIRQAEISKGMSTKAGAALRRSGVRIRSLGTGHTSLNLVISELSSVRQTLKDSIAAQQRGQGLLCVIKCVINNYIQLLMLN